MNQVKSIDIIVQEASIDMNIEIITDTLATALSPQNKTLPFMERIIKMLPELDEQIHKKLSQEELNKLVQSVLKQRFLDEKESILKMVEQKNLLIERDVLPATEEMLKLFNFSYEKTQQIYCYLGFFNPFPRDVLKKEYCTHYLVSDEIFIRSSLHEINHMILFDKWKSMYGYEKEKEPEFPEPLWYLEELSIEPILNTRRIQRLAPFEHKAYDSFYKIIINGKSLPEQIQNIYKNSSNIEEYLTKSYKYIEQYFTNS